MKNKLLKFLLVLPLFGSNLTTLTSCNSSNNIKIQKFDYQAYYEENKTYTDYNNTIYFKTADEYVNLVNEKQDFILFVSDDSCGSCTSFDPIKNTVMGENEVLNYTIDTKFFTQVQKKLGYSKTDYVTPLLLIYNDGVMSKEIRFEKYESAFLNPSKFKELLLDNINLTNLYYENSVEIENNKFYFTNKIDDEATSSIYHHTTEKRGFIFLLNFDESYYKAFVESDLYIISSGYSNYTISVGNYKGCLSYIDNTYVGELNFNINSSNQSISIPQYTNNEDSDDVEKYYPVIGLTYVSTGKINSINKNLSSYEDIIKFIEAYK